MDLLKSEIYLCRQTSQRVFSAPVKIMANVMPANSDGDILAYGIAFPEYLKIRGDLNADLSVIQENDKMYFRKDLPAVHDTSQTTKTSANFFVSSRPIVTKHNIEITLKRIQDR